MSFQAHPQSGGGSAALHNVAAISRSVFRLRFGVRRCLRRFSMQAKLGAFVTAPYGLRSLRYNLARARRSAMRLGGMEREFIVAGNLHLNDVTSFDGAFEQLFREWILKKPFHRSAHWPRP